MQSNSRQSGFSFNQPSTRSKQRRITGEEKLGLHPKPREQVEEFRNFVNSNRLMDIDLKGGKFTWFSKPRNSFARQGPCQLGVEEIISKCNRHNHQGHFANARKGTGCGIYLDSMRR
ncbi:hypothetical protein Ahy_Scaffold1g107105 isoform B [Arachis hypogaea]|uniref:Uncharacterized protein n=1 Tax=Arachis hypogaea TaxID=3818 RepID=A0A444WUI8_ARAHY|nr:hypothetical protein Ahy_Scaffold1g107105 isoform B [Arachis hypogaea]